MLKLLKNKLLLLLLAAVCSCGPVYQTTFSYSPPSDLPGNTCLNGCQSNQQQCEWNERSLHQECERRAEMDYNFCESGKRYSYNYKKKRTDCVENCYCSRDTCPEPNIPLCTDRYNSCYVGCGGTVVATTQCVSSCEKANPPTTQILRGAVTK